MNHERHCFVPAEVIVESLLCRAFSGLRISCAIAGALDLFCQFDDLFQTFLVPECLRLAFFDQRVQQLGHLFVIFRIDRCFVDDQLADVILDGFRNRFAITPYPGRERFHGIDTAFEEELNLRHIVECRYLHALFGPDVGVEEMPHGRFVEDLALADRLRSVEFIKYFADDLFAMARCVSQSASSSASMLLFPSRYSRFSRQRYLRCHGSRRQHAPV